MQNKQVMQPINSSKSSKILIVDDEILKKFSASHRKDSQPAKCIHTEADLSRNIVNKEKALTRLAIVKKFMR